MSSSFDFIQVLQTIQTNLYIIGGPILLCIGTVNCVCNLIIFTRNSLRKNPCTICLIAFNFSSLLFLYFSLLPALLQLGYDIEPGSYNLVYCRIRYYLGFLFACLPPFYLILASIDRTLVTASNVRIRQWSNRHVMYKCIFGLTLFWTLFHIHALFHTNIIEFAANYSVCYFDPGLYSVLVSYYLLIVNGIIPPLLLAVFGLLTMRNIYRSRSRIVPSTVGNNSIVTHQRNQQLIRMLLTEIAICILLNFIHPGVLLYQHISPYDLTDFRRTIINSFMISISTFILHLPYCISFYTNLIVSKTFRGEVKNLLIKQTQVIRTQTI